MLLGLGLLEGGLWGAGRIITTHDQPSDVSEADGEGLRVLCLGACYTLGVGGDPDDAWPAQLERLLVAHDPAQRAQVTNGAVRSKGVDFFAERIERLLDTHRPDVVVVNVNDRILYRVAAERSPSVIPVWLRGRLASSRVFRLARLLRAPPEALPIEDEAELDPNAGDAHRAMLLEATRSHPDDSASWLALAQLYANHGQYALAMRALDQAESVGAAGAVVARFGARLAALAGRYARAAAAWEGLRAAAGDEAKFARQAQAGSLLARLRVAPISEIVPAGMETMDAYAELGEWGVAEAVADEVIARVPGAADAYDYRNFCRFMQQGGQLSAPDTDAFFEKRVSAPRSAAGFGMYARDARSAEANAAAFWEVLDANLGAIARAAQARGVKVVVEDLSSMPQQRPILEAEAQLLGIPYIHVQDALAEYPDRAALMHPEQHLRLSKRGNAVVAETVFQGLHASGVLE